MIGTRAKGREKPGFTHITEAQKILAIGYKSIRMLIVCGQLPGYKDYRGWWCSTADLQRLKEMRGIEVSPESAQRTAGAALVMATQAMNQVTELLQLLGLEAGGVPSNEDDAKLWVMELEQDGNCIAAIVHDVEETRRCAKVLLAITEPFISWLVQVVDDPSVWARIKTWSSRLVRACEMYEPASEGLRRAHQLVKVGEGVTRSACFFYLCSTAGSEYAIKFFPEATGKIDEEMVSIILERQSIAALAVR